MSQQSTASLIDIGRTDYDEASHAYQRRRQPDPRIAQQIVRALASARTVLNVGAGQGAYEPIDRQIFALDPAAGMLARHPGRALAVQGRAEQLPYRDGSFDAALSILSLHHWQDWQRGVAELRRVARERIVLFGWDPAHPGFWLTQDYLPGFRALDRTAFPALDAVCERPGGDCEIQVLPVPRDCSDGFLGAYWARPEAYLLPEVRASISTFQRVAGWETGIQRLREELADGSWMRKYGALLNETAQDLGYRLIVAHLNHPGTTSS